MKIAKRRERWICCPSNVQLALHYDTPSVHQNASSCTKSKMFFKIVFRDWWFFGCCFSLSLSVLFFGLLSKVDLPIILLFVSLWCACEWILYNIYTKSIWNISLISNVYFASISISNKRVGLVGNDTHPDKTNVNGSEHETQWQDQQPTTNIYLNFQLFQYFI